MNPVCCYDFTLKSSAVKNHDEIISWLTTYCKKWAFQKELSEGGYEHYQGRFSLKVKKRLDTLVECFPWKAVHFSPTSTQNQGNMFYVVKDETRIEGPWKDSDEPPPYIPKQVTEIKSWYPWQARIQDLARIWDTRTVHIIVDDGHHSGFVGNKGKSVLCTALGAARLAFQIPYCNDYKDILRMVLAGVRKFKERKTPLGCFLIDMPKAINKEKVVQMFAAIETVKSGYAYDERYDFKCEYFDSPNIFVFTNEVPNPKHLSVDRWKIWAINRDMQLIPYELNVPALQLLEIVAHDDSQKARPAVFPTLIFDEASSKP